MVVPSPPGEVFKMQLEQILSSLMLPNQPRFEHEVGLESFGDPS